MNYIALKKITVEFDEKFLPLIAMKNKELPKKIKEFVVFELYRRKEISSGKAAELLNMEKFEFINYSSRMGIPFLDMDEADLILIRRQRYSINPVKIWHRTNNLILKLYI